MKFTQVIQRELRQCKETIRKATLVEIKLLEAGVEEPIKQPPVEVAAKRKYCRSRDSLINKKYVTSFKKHVRRRLL